MRRPVQLASLLLFCATANAGDPPKPLMKDLKLPTAIAVGDDGRIYIGLGNVDIERPLSAIMIADKDKMVPFSNVRSHKEWQNDPVGMVAWGKWFFVLDSSSLFRLDYKGGFDQLVPKAKLKPYSRVQAITVDEQGTLYISAHPDDPAILLALKKALGGAIFRIDQEGTVTRVTHWKRNGALKSPKGLVIEGKEHLLVCDDFTGELLRIKIADGSSTKVVEGLGHPTSIARDKQGRVYVADEWRGKIFVIPRPGAQPVLLAKDLARVTGICVDPTGKQLLVLEANKGILTAIPLASPEADEKPRNSEVDKK
jgi:sugar lactone lactonase YvrE